MTTITKTQLENASLDAISLASFTNGAANEEVLTRLGETYPTIQKLISNIYTQTGYLVPVTYTSGISLATPNQTVEYDGETYAPLLSELPFTTSGTFETAKFRVIQGVTQADLAAGYGTTLIGYSPAGTGNIDSMLNDRLDKNIIAEGYTTIENAISAAGTSEIVQVTDTPTYTAETIWNGRKHQTDEAPFLLNSVSWSGANLNARMCVSDGMLYCAEYANNSVAIFNLLNPRTPAFLSRFATGANPRHVEVVGRYVFVACHGANTIEVHDVSNPAQPSGTLIGTIATGANPKMFQIIGNELVVCCYGASKIEKHSFVLPTSGVTSFTSTKLGEIAVSDGPLCVAYNGSGLLVVCGLGTSNVDIVGYTTLNLLTQNAIGSAGHACCVWLNKETIAFTDSSENKLRIAKVGDLYVTVTGTVTTSPNPEQIEIVGGRCYVPSLTNSGVQAYLDCFEIINLVPVKYKSVPLTITGAGFTAFRSDGENGYIYVSGHFTPYDLNVVEILNGPSGRPENYAFEKLYVQNQVNQAYGTWTPALGDSAGNVIPCSFAVGTYAKIGKLIHISVDCIWSSIGSVGSTDLIISNLPFATQNIAASRHSAAIGYLKGFPTSSGAKQITASSDENSTTLTFRANIDGGNPSGIAANTLSASGGVQVSMTYISV